MIYFNNDWIFSRPNLKSEVENVTLEENHWQISTSMLVDVDAGPETIKCELRIPDANYSKMKEAYYSSRFNKIIFFRS